jgi:hypothetical protein
MPSTRRIGTRAAAALALTWAAAAVCAQTPAPPGAAQGSPAIAQLSPQPQSSPLARPSIADYGVPVRGVQRAECVPEGESCKAPDAVCCTGLLCFGVPSPICMPKA